MKPATNGLETVVLAYKGSTDIVTYEEACRRAPVPLTPARLRGFVSRNKPGDPCGDNTHVDLSTCAYLFRRLSAQPISGVTPE